MEVYRTDEGPPSSWPVGPYLNWMRERLPARAGMFVGDGSDLLLDWDVRSDVRVSRFCLTEATTGEKLVIDGNTWLDSRRGEWLIDILDVEAKP